MRVLVQGAGALGTWLAVTLVSGSSEDSVALLDRDKDRARRLSSSGIRLTVGSIEVTAQVDVLAVGSPVEAFDLLIVCVKHGDLDQALTDGLPFVAPGGHVVILVNGLGQREIVGDRWFVDRVWLGAVTYGAMLLDEGHVEQTGEGVIRVASLDQDLMGPLSVPDVFSPLVAAGVSVDRAPDVELMLWEKAIVNCAINPVAALVRLTNGELRESPAYQVSLALAKEVALVGRAHLVAKGRDDRLIDAWDKMANDFGGVVDGVCRRTASNRCSMLRDLDVGRKTEIDALNLAVARRASELGCDAPLNRAVAALVQAAERTLS